jgi:septum formation protein
MKSRRLVQNTVQHIYQQDCRLLALFVMHSVMDRILTEPPPLTLASASRSRSMLLDQIGISHTQRPVRIDEDAIRDALVQEGASPRDIADALAEFKALRSSKAGLILGCDQILALKSEIFAKPRDRAEAAQHLSRLSGQTHHLYSAAVIYEDGQPVWRHVGLARMTMHHLTADEIESYLDLTWPDVATSVGAYHAEGYGARLFARIDGDWFSVLGLPLLEISSYLRLRGWR